MESPDFSFEEPLWKKGFSVIGIDEVGRGAFAGPVGVGGVVFSPNLSSKEKKFLLSLGINDSKKLSKKKREELSVVIKDLAACYSISFVPVEIINDIGVGKATFLGMNNVFAMLKKHIQNPYLLIDAFEIPNLSKDIQKGIIRGDSLSISIAAASIIAKVERDRLMEKLSGKFPSYMWESNKGYGTLKHRMVISELGLSSQHRVEFCRHIETSLSF